MNFYKKCRSHLGAAFFCSEMVSGFSLFASEHCFPLRKNGKRSVKNNTKHGGKQQVKNNTKHSGKQHNTD